MSMARYGTLARRATAIGQRGELGAEAALVFGTLALIVAATADWLGVLAPVTAEFHRLLRGIL
ncbi:hypothetical protein [Caldovatus aquaticus]|uniref:Flp family type IVb pilin n=1 Tax=Caldovatus aquaticus TaxID=2865671 RepID=A0ABS7F7C9_9PROT|nr:hypothetical protein [Caldovatus aquaticus]MBW8271524.1 hypothetical protein [Caldovatus aquaticus]